MSSETPNEASLFNAARKIESNEERNAYLDSACQGDAALRERVHKLLSVFAAESQFLEAPAPGLEATLITQTSAEDRDASLQAGLAAAFNHDQAVVLADGSHSVLKMLGQTLGTAPRVALRESADQGADPIVRPKSPEMPGRDSDSRYRIDGEIARGGMGAILKGCDTDLGRDLAIKVLLDQHKDKPEVIQRFIEEAQIGGQLQHPGVAPVYELGQFADRRPFFSMKLVKGETLSKLLADREGAAEDRARFIGIFEQVCQTMAYAHSRGVIHRDLKPANVMVGAFGEVQVMDWGLAKVLPAGGVADEKKAHDTQMGKSIIQTMRSGVGSDAPGTLGSLGSHTQMGSVMGTPAYMPPEQALGEIDQMDERADVFGLGAILCEILTGKPPYVADDGTRVFRLASRGRLEDCFQRLDACGADAELIALTKHCLELEPADRPRNAGVLASRVTEYLESVETRLREAELRRAAESARAEEALHTAHEHEVAARAERRARKLQAGLAVVVLCVTTIGGIAAVWTAAVQGRLKNEALLAKRDADLARDQESKQLQRAESEWGRAEIEKTRAETARQQAEGEKIRSVNMLADMQTERGLQAGREGKSATAALWFANAATLTPHDLDRQRANHLRAASSMNEALAPAALLNLPEGDARRFSFQPAGSLLLTVSGVRLRVWDWRNEVALPWSEALVDVMDANWSPDGRQLAVGFGNGEVRLHEPSSGRELKRFQHAGRVEVLQWSPDGTRLAVGGMLVQIWNVTAEPVREADWPHPKRVFAVNFNRAGTQLLTSCDDEFARMFAVGDALKSAPLYAPVEHVPNSRTWRGAALFCDEDRKFVTVHRKSARPVLADAESGHPVVPGWTTGDGADRHLAVNPDGRWVVAAGGRGAFLLRVDGQSLELLHGNHVQCVTFTPDGQSLVTTCYDGAARWWPLHDLTGASPSAGSPVTLPQRATFADCAVSPDGSSLAIAADHQVVIWERPQSQAVVGQIDWPGFNWRPRPSFDGRLVTAGARHEYSATLQPRDAILQVARMADGRPAGPPITLDGLLFDSCICADNRSVAAATVNGTTGILAIFEIASGTPVIPSVKLPDLPISLAARPRESQVAVLCRNGQLLAIDTREGGARLDLSHESWSGDRMMTSRVAYSPDGATLLTVTPHNLVFVRHAQTGELRFPPLRPVLAEGGTCRTIAFSSDGRLLATAVNGRNMVQVWDLVTGERVGQKMPHPGDAYGLFSVAFSPDGQRILTGHKDGRARLWDWKAGQLVGAPMRHPDEVFEARFTPDGRHVLCAVRHNAPRVWDIATSKPAVPLPQQLVPPGSSSESFGIAGNRVVVAAGNVYSVLDLSLLLQQPTDEVPALLTRAELTTNQKLQLGELVPLETTEWASRWEQLVAARQTPEAAAESLARAFAEATTDSARRAIITRALRFNLTERLRNLRPDDPRLYLALIAEFSRVGREADLKQVLPQAISLVQEALKTTPNDDALQQGLLRLMVEDLPVPEWSRLEPTSMTAKSNCTFSVRPDGSILAGSAAVRDDRYSFSSRSPIRKIAAVRLETIPHPSLPKGGAGWDIQGNFNLAKVKLTVNRADGTTLPLEFGSAASDFVGAVDIDTTPEDGPWGAIDDDRSTEWDTFPVTDKPHWLSLQLKQPCDLAMDDELTIELDFHSAYLNSRLGCFRLSFTADEHAAETQMLRTAMSQSLFNGTESLAALHLARGEAAAALKQLQAATGSGNPSTTRQLLLARAHSAVGETDAARHVVNQLLENVTTQPPPRTLYGLFLEVATEISGLTRGELQTRRERSLIDQELARLANDIQANAASSAAYSARATFLARLGRWREATEDCGHARKLTPENRFAWFKEANCRLFAGDEADYQQLCRAMVEQFRGTGDCAIADSVCKACLLRPGTIELSELPIPLLRDATNDPQSPMEFRPWGEACCGLISYRERNYDEAITWTKKTAKLSGSRDALALIVRAMAEHQLGQHAQARQTLTEATSLIPHQLATLGRSDYDGRLPVPSDFVGHDWLAAENLRREAQTLIHGSPERKPAGTQPGLQSAPIKEP